MAAACAASLVCDSPCSRAMSRAWVARRRMAVIAPVRPAAAPSRVQARSRNRWCPAVSASASADRIRSSPAAISPAMIDTVAAAMDR